MLRRAKVLKRHSPQLFGVREKKGCEDKGRRGEGCYNFAPKYLKETGIGDPEQLVQDMRGMFGPCVMEECMKVRLEQERSRRAKGLQAIRTYAARPLATRRTFVAGQIMRKVNPSATKVFVLSTTGVHWGRPLTSVEQEQAQRGASVAQAFRATSRAEHGGNAGADACAQLRSSEGDQSPADGKAQDHGGEASGEMKQMGAEYGYLTTGEATAGPHFARKDNLYRVVTKHVIEDQRMYTREVPRRRICVFEAEREEALALAHDADVAGRWKGLRTWHRLPKSAYWPGFKEDAAGYAASCPDCQARGGTGLKVRAPMGSFPYLKKPFRLVACDLKQMPATKCGVRWMAVALCHSTKFVETGPLPAKTALCVGEFLSKGVFLRYGLARYMLTDRGGELTIGLTAVPAEKLGISQRLTAPYRPQSYGVAERTVCLRADRLGLTGQVDFRQH